MDKKLLAALSNLSIALQEISDSLDGINRTKETSNSSIVEAFKSLDINEQLKSIDEGVKKIQEDNKQIVKTQKQILSQVSKPAATTKENSLINTKDQRGIKDGVSLILLIAGGVLAIGLAFKLIGTVDFKSVIALSLSLPLIAFAFEKVAKVKSDIKSLAIVNFGLIMMAGTMVIVSKLLNFVTPISADKLVTTVLISGAFVLLSDSIGKISQNVEGINVRNLWKLPLVLLAASAAIAASSWILQWVKPVGFLQMVTVVFIAGSFAIVALSIDKLVDGIKSVDVKSLWKLPLVLIATSAAIAASSWILQWVKPVGFNQLLTVIMISSAFAVLSFGLGKLVKAMDKISLKGVALLPLVLVGVSLAITGSSYILSKIVPISFPQALTTILIAATFTILSYGLPKVVDAVSKIKIKDIPMIPLVLIAMSAAILGSSYLFSKVQTVPFGTLVNIAFQSIALTVVAIAIGFAMSILDKLGISPSSKALMGGVSIVIIATTLMTSSLIISLGQYSVYPDLSWTLNMAASMLIFGAGMARIASTIGLPALIIGGIGILVIAGTILATDAILSNGEYKVYPTLPWVLGVGASLTAFGLVMVASAFGIIALAIGYLSISLIANSIVKVANILSGGEYGKYPSLSWILGVGLSLGAFGTIMVASGIGIIALGLGYLSIKMIANSIVETSQILSNGKFTGGPSLGWALGTSVLLTTFGMSMMLLGGFVAGTLGLGYVALLAGKSALKVIAQSIVDASFILSNGNYKDGPTKEWAEGVALSIGAFAPVYKTLTSKGLLGAIFGGGGSSPAKMKQAIVTISEGIITAAQFFSKNTVAFKNGPPVEWAEGVGLSIRAFAPVFEALAKNKSWFSSGLDMDEMVNAVHGISQGIITSAEIFNQNRTTFGGTYPSVSWAEGVGLAIRAFNPVIEYAASISGITSNVDSDWLYKNIKFFAKAMVETANILSGNYEGSRGKPNYNNIIPDNYTQTLTSLYSSFYKLVSDKKIASLDSDNFGVFYAMAGSISNTSIILSKGNYKLIPLDYMTNLTSNIIQYSKLLSYLKGTNESETKLLGLVTISRASDITRMASDYDKLANSIQNLSGAIQSIDVERITALKTLTGSIVLMSLMDSDQFNSMMDSLESKARIFVDVINDMENGVSGKEISINAGGAKQSGPTMQDVVNVMSRMDAKLGQLVSYSSSISLKINEIKTNKGIKGK